MKWLFFILIIFFCVNQAYATKKCGSCHEEHYAEVATCVSCHKGVDGTKRKDIAHYKLIGGKYAKFLLPDSKEVRLGRQLVNEGKCSRCHNIDGRGGLSASNLDISIARLNPADIFDAIKNPTDNMPIFSLSDENIDNIVNLLYYNNYRADIGSSIVQTVHINNTDNLSVFNDKCGGCHKFLSSGGVFGAKSLAPNLSALLSFKELKIVDKAWNVEILTLWLQNPRKVKDNATMPLIKLSNDETKIILEMFLR